MLINCPRCGFSQPKDQYCAQCGVDMQAFKPKSVPLTKKFFQSTTTHVALLLIGTVFVGQYVIRSEEPQRWVQKITRSQGVTKSKSKFDDSSVNDSGVAESASEASQKNQQNWNPQAQLESLRNKEIAVNANVEQPIQTGSSASTEANAAGNPETIEPTFRVLYAEVPIATMNRWVSDSSNAGLYQNLQDYSAGIVPEFRKKMDSTVRVLKSAEKKLAPGQSDTNFSGTVGEESGQIIGIATNIEFRNQENGVVHGSIMVNRTQRQGRENFPAEFDLPRGAALVLMGTIKSNSFAAEREQLSMPPFQIFKSPDFAARKTEFVIILEAEYK